MPLNPLRMFLDLDTLLRRCKLPFNVRMVVLRKKIKNTKKTKDTKNTKNTKNTNKVSKNEKSGMTVPQLRRAFEHIDRVVNKGCSVAEFRKEWKKTFGKEISEEAASEYLQFVGAKQAGGAAPIGYELRAGADIPHGSYPEYVSSGFGFANASGISAQCGKEVWPSVPASLGTNKVGGKRLRMRKLTRKLRKNQEGGALPPLGTAFSEFLSRPFGMSAPPTSAQDLQMLSKGYNGLSSPRPEIPSFTIPSQPVVYNANVATTARTF